MIKSFADKVTQDIYDGTNSRYSRKLPRNLHPKARRLLDQINAAPSLEFLRIPLVTGLKSSLETGKDIGA